MLIGPNEPTSARAHDRKERRIAARIAKAMPADVKRYFVRKYNANAEEAFRQLLTGSDHVCEKCNCHRPSHHGVRMFLEMAGAVGTPGQVLIANFLDKVGARDETEARTLVESGRRMEQLRDGDVDAATMADDFVEGLKLIFARAPELRDSVMARLSSGVVEIDTNTNTEWVENTNGNGAHEANE